MAQNSKLTLEALAIGSLPHTNLESAMELVKKDFDKIPFWPQLSKINKNEDMIFQFLENMPSFFIDENTGKSYLETESDKFFEDMEQFFADYEEIIHCFPCESEGDRLRWKDCEKILDKYAISYSCTFPEFIKIVKDTKPAFAKGQIVGPFTLATTLVDKTGKCAFYDETLKEIIIKTLTLKALWQIKEIKCANPDTTPIIFIDEPSISQLGTSAYITISNDEVKNMIKEISDLVKANGALSAIHCCGKCDWRVPIEAGVDIINFDAYTFAQNLSLFSSDLKCYLEQGRKIAWGIVPTLRPDSLEKTNLNEMISVFEKAVKYLTKKGIDEKIIIENSIITPSCGAGALSEELAQKAMDLTKQLSENLKERRVAVPPAT